MKNPVGYCLVLILLALVFSMGCTAFATPTPTPTPVPTSTPTPAPTDTPRPTATPADPNALPSAIAFALNKTGDAKSMRFDFESLITLVREGKEQVVPGLSLSGIDSTLNRHVTISGTSSETNHVLTYEVIIVGDEVYLKGLEGVAGVDPQKWYRVPPEMEASVRGFPTARGLLASFDAKEFGKAQFASTGGETLDNQQCSLWSAKNPEAALNLIGITNEGDLKKQLGSIDTTQFKVWTCADGYIHRMTGQVNGHDANNTANKTKVDVRFALADFDQALAVQTPEGANLFPTPASTPTRGIVVTVTPAQSATAALTETETATATPTPQQ
jgi:hypothetical protein